MAGKTREPHKRILIVDDDDLMDVFYKSLFSRHEDEFDCRFADSGQDALKDIRQGRPDALVLDWDMPEIGGRHLLEVLRSEPAARAARVLAISGRSGVDDQVQALESGADDYLSKPFDARVFIARLRALVRRWE